MKKLINSIFTLVVILASQTIAFAQAPPSDFGDIGDPNADNLDATPVDSYIWVLLLLGVVYVYSKYKWNIKA